MTLEQEDLDLLARNGWTITCESPLEIRHEAGSFASGLAARYALDEILNDLRNDNQVCQLTAYEVLIETVERLNRAFDVALTDKSYTAWEQAYAIVFSEHGSSLVSKCLEAITATPIDYYDPDTSYEDDVTAYMSALNEQMHNVKKFEDSFPTVTLDM